MTALLNSTTTLNNGLRMTELERRYGRLMRSPDGHDSADAGAASAAGDAGASGDAGSADAGAASGDASGEAVDSTLLGSATTDTGTGDTKSEDSKTQPSPTPVPDDVPETYELKLTTTNDQGEEVATDLDASLVEIATPLLKDAKLSNEQANKLLPMVPQIQERVLTQMNDEFAATRANWAKEAQADPEIGGKNWAETQRLAALALDSFGAKSEIVDGKETNAFRVLLNDSGLGNHPTLIRMFRDIGAARGEDGQFTRNTAVVETPLSREQRNYPDDQPK